MVAQQVRVGLGIHRSWVAATLAKLFTALCLCHEVQNFVNTDFWGLP